MAKKQATAEQVACVMCSTTEPGDRRRGVCVSCYEKIRRAKDKMSDERAEQWDAYLVAEGKLNPAYGKEGDPVADALAAFLKVLGESKQK